MKDLSVLIVEDSGVQRQHAVELCQSLGVVHIIEATDGLDALSKLLAKPCKVDIALVDLEMPRMDGIALIRMLAAEKLVSAVIVLSKRDPVLISTVGTMAEMGGLMLLGAVEKPLTQEKLRALLSKFRSNLALQEDELPLKDYSADDIRQALQESQFHLYYQPKISTRAGLLKGLEVLLRWLHPEHGLVPAEAFVPAAEHYGLGGELLRYVFERALVQMRLWSQRGMMLNIGINVSSQSLSEPDFVDVLEQLILQYHSQPRQFTLELSDSALSVDASRAIATLARLRLKGFGIAIDNFGAGSTTQQLLSRVPVTEIKIDRSFVHGAADRPAQRAILENTLDLARRLNLSSVAQGVEDKTDFLLVRALGYEFAQGYFVGRPMDGDQLLEWIKQDLPDLRNV